MIGILTNEEIAELLRTNVLGRIGCNDGEKNYVVPINYAFDGKDIIAHSAMGLKIKIMRKNPQVCFEVDEMHSFTNWKSVIAWGEYQELRSQRERYYAIKLFADRMMHIKISETAIPPANGEYPLVFRQEANSKSVIYRIVVNELSGRFES
ncbi:MAG: pyridoxamine 5'-phosphate oxidase family protein [Ferruginibacter sp.]